MEMSKVIWSPEYISYKFDRLEPFYDDGHFKLKRSNEDDGHNIEVTNLNYINVIAIDTLYIYCPFGTFKEGDVLIVGDTNYIYENIELPEKPKPEEKPQVPDISINGILFKNKKNKFVVINTYEDKPIKIEYTIEEYTREVYPEFPFNIIDKEAIIQAGKELELYSLDRGKIAIIHITDDYGYDCSFEYENMPLYHFSTVESLKQAIKDTGFAINEKTDEEYKRLISEKSVYMKKRFGLTEKELKNIELFPAFKSVVNLYCIKELMAVSFIQGTNSSSPIYTSPTSLTLGKYKTDGESNEGSILTIDAIELLIKKQEYDLNKSIFNESSIIKRRGIVSDNILEVGHQCILRKCLINNAIKKK